MRHIHGLLLVALLAVGCAEFRIVDLGDAGAGPDAGSEPEPEPEPLSFNVDSTPSRIMQGTMMKVPVSITRSGSSAKDIQITVTGLPLGMTANPLTIPAASSTKDLEITVAPEVPQGPVNATIQGRAVGGQGLVSADLPLFVRGRVGSFDTTFATDGRLVDVFGRSSAATNVMVSADDHIFVVGLCRNAAMNAQTCVARLTTQGMMDAAYGVNGVATLNKLSPSAAVLLSDGRVVVGGTSQYGRAAYGVFQADGTPDNPDGPTGLVTTIGSTGATVFSMAPTPDGGIVIGFQVTMVEPPSTQGMGIAKFTSAMKLVEGFGTGGFVGANFVGKGTSMGNGVVVRPNGNLVIAGCGYDGANGNGSMTGSGYGVMQLLGDSGIPDPSFGADGANGQTWFLSPGTISCGFAGSASLTSKGQVVASVGGMIWAFTANGTSVDTSFGNRGALPVQSDLVIPRVFLDDQDRPIVTRGNVGTLESVSRFTSTGAVDSSFGSGGVVASPLPKDFSSAYSVAASAQSDGRIVVLSAAFPPSMVSADGIVVLTRLWN